MKVKFQGFYQGDDFAIKMLAEHIVFLHRQLNGLAEACFFRRIVNGVYGIILVHINTTIRINNCYVC